MEESALAFGWEKWLFRIVADEEFARVWADRSELRAELDRRIRRLKTVPHSTVQMIWADFGAGKSHALRRLEVITLVGFAFIALQARFTNWAFALYGYGALIAGNAARQAPVAYQLDAGTPMPDAARRRFGYVWDAAFVSPIVIGLIWFHWWWGLLTLVCGGIGASSALSIAPVTKRLAVGGALWAGASVYLVWTIVTR